MAKQSKPAVDRAVEKIAGECLAVRVRMLNRTITSIYDEALRPLGLTVGQLNILVLIGRRGPISPTDVSRRLSMEKSTVSRNVERMRSSGWISVSSSGKQRELDLTRVGKQLLVESLPAWNDAQARARSLLGRKGSDSIRSLGNTVWSSMGVR